MILLTPRVDWDEVNFYLLTSHFSLDDGGLAQLARAPALQAGGQRFESVILHTWFLFCASC